LKNPQIIVTFVPIVQDNFMRSLENIANLFDLGGGNSLTVNNL
jgi:hypothetical protein